MNCARQDSSHKGEWKNKQFMEKTCYISVLFPWDIISIFILVQYFSLFFSHNAHCQTIAQKHSIHNTLYNFFIAGIGIGLCHEGYLHRAGIWDHQMSRVIEGIIICLRH